MQGLENQLDSDKAQDDAKAVAQVDELAEQRVHKEEELAQTHECEYVARKHEERLRRDAEDCGDRIKGKHEVG